MVEVERNIRTLEGPTWTQVQLPSDALDSAYNLLYQHSPSWIGPLRDATDGFNALRVWIQGCRGSFPGNETAENKERMLRLLSGSYAELNKMSDALVPGRSSERVWDS